MKHATGVLAAFIFMAEVGLGATIHVPGDQSTIQEGINVTNPNDTVLVADGVYSGAGNVNIDFAGRSITVLSENGPDHCTILCTAFDNVGAGPAFIFQSSEDSTALVAGFTISGGELPHNLNGGGMRFTNSSPTIRDVVFLNGGTSGVTVCIESSPTFIDCTFKSNICGCSACTLAPGKGLSQNGGGALRCVDNSNPLLTGCVFEDNASDAQEGGALACYDSSPVLRSCMFAGNRSVYFERGGAVFLRNSSPSFDSCWFRDNGTQLNGGAVCITAASQPVFFACVFSGNIASYGGGAVYSQFSAPQFSYCSFISNWANQDDCCSYGGAISLDSSVSTITNCTFVGNSIDTDGYDRELIGSVIYSTNSRVEVVRSVIAFNGDGGTIWFDETNGELSLECTNIYANAGGDWEGPVENQGLTNGNFSADPLFCDHASGNLNLQGNSPCTPPGNECAAQIGAFGIGCVITDVQVGVASTVPNSISLAQNYPNPFNPVTTIEYYLPLRSRVSLNIYNLLGQEIARLVDGVMPAGQNVAIWNGRDSKGDNAASGVYFYRLTVNGFMETRKMVLMK
jgi:hypothetical protein